MTTRERHADLIARGVKPDHAKRMLGIGSGQECPDNLPCDNCSGRGCVWCDWCGEVILLAGDPTPAEIVERIEEVQAMREASGELKREEYEPRVRPVEIQRIGLLDHSRRKVVTT